jgi:hypothetical protein
MRRRTYFRALVASGIVGAGVTTHGSGSVLQSVQAQSDDGWDQQAKLVPDDGDEGDRFAADVAVSGDGTTAVIGAQFDEEPNGAGSAYVFSRDGDTWTQQTKLFADDGNNDSARFGEYLGVSSDGTTAVIGAPSDDDPNGGNAGSAYVFSRDSGSWSQQAKLAAEDGDDVDRFGTSVSVSSDGTTAVIGAQGDEDPNGEFAGSAYIFSQDGDAWSQQAKLFADDGEEDDSFGDNAVSSDGTTAVIGASNDDNSNGTEAGSAYVFDQDEDTWSQQAKLAADDGDQGDRFAADVAVSSDGMTAVISAQGNDNPNGEFAGAAYVFSRDGDSWSQQAKLIAEDGDAEDAFGTGVAVSSDGTTAVIGAAGDDDPNGEVAGSTYVFTEAGGTWSQQAKLAADDGDDGDLFGGGSVAVSSDGATAVIPAEFDEDPNGAESGSAYVFTAGDGDDEPQAVLDLTASGDATTADSAATVEFTLTNTGDATADTPGLQLGGIWTDTDWEIVSADGDGGDWSEADGFWQIDELAPQESQAPAVTLAVPADASAGDYVLEADAYVDIEADPVAEASATIQVEDSDDGPPALPGQEKPPQDHDGDGLYEDIDGDGTLTIDDVHVFFENRDADVVQNNAERFNFAGNGSADVTLDDVQALYQLLIDS